ncbi:MAG: glycosyltransferase family 2 protein [Deltaproteobacteria bacterium]|nr:glycosyltransferase family 2 protein [Deltaproteobacteria bacterium]
MTPNDLISVVIPTYNGSKYILSTVLSALSQTYSPVEIIVVDDGSTEDMAAVLNPVIGHINYIRQENSGPAAARNHGILVSKGEYIAFLDHDDHWLPENLTDKMAVMKNNPECAMVYSYPELIDGSGMALRQEYPLIFPSGEVFEEFLLSNRITTFSATLIRKNIFEMVGMLDERPEITCCDDYDMWLRIADVDKIIFSPDRNVKYRLHEQNLLKNHNLSFCSHLNVFEKALNECSTVSQISQKKLSKIVNEHLYNKYWSYAFKFYYDMCNYKMTRNLLWHCVLSKPFNFRNWIYLLLCSLPSSFITSLRSAKSFVKMIVLICPD